MSFNVSKTSSIPCLQKLVDAINADAAIITVCEFIRLDDPDTMILTFQGAGPLSGAEDAALDSLLGLFTCPPVFRVINTFTLNANTFEFPSNSNWAVNQGPATSEVDNIDNSLTVRSFDDNNEEGIGALLPKIPTEVTNLRFTLTHRRRSGTSAATVPISLYARTVPDGSPPGAWSAGATLTTLTIPTNTSYTNTEVVDTVGTLGIIVGETNQIQITRKSGTLSGDWYLLQMKVEYLV